MDDDLEMLIEDIRKAFEPMTKPSDENIIVGDNAHFAICDECRDLRDYFWGRTRESIAQNEDAYRQTINAFSFFTPIAWHYYLPEYLIGCLQNNRLRVDDLWHHEEPIVREGLWPARIQQLNAQQCAVLIAYLKYALKRFGANPEQSSACQRILNWWQENYQNRFGTSQPV